MSGQSRSDLDAYVTRLGQMTEEVTMWTLDPNWAVVPHFHVGPDIIRVLVVDEHDLRGQVDRIAAEFMHWGRIAARQQRCQQVRERKLRQWKAHDELAYRKDCADKGTKAPTEEMVKAHYRTAPEYDALQAEIEQAKEAAMVADVIYQAFKMKKDVLRADVYRAPDGTLQRLSV